MSTPQSFSKDDFAKIFKRDDIRGIWPDELNCGVAHCLGRCLARLTGADQGRCIVVGHDARRGSFELLDALCAGIEAAGGQVRNLGLCSSEQIYYMAGRHAETYVAGAMVTASHNPREYNGVKFVHAGAVPFSRDDLQNLRRLLEENYAERRREGVGDEFAEHLAGLAELSTMARPAGAPLKVVVAAGHGVGALAFRPLGERLKPLGIDCVYLDAEPDGDFPDGVPNPLLAAFNARLGDAVRKNGADLGIGFDGDADRAGFTDRHGEPLTASQVLALVGSAKLAAAPAGTKPVLMRNLCCSQLLRELFASRAELVDTPVGHGQIKQLMGHPHYAGRVLYAGEHSGHYFYPEFYNADSGILTTLYMLKQVQALRASGRSLEDELSVWRRRFLWSGEINFRMPDTERTQAALAWFRQQGASGTACRRYEIRRDVELGGLQRVFVAQNGTTVEEGVSPDVKLEAAEGQGGWWLVVRPSGNEPMLRVNIEVWDLGKERLAEQTAEAERVIAGFGGVRM